MNPQTCRPGLRRTLRPEWPACRALLAALLSACLSAGAQAANVYVSATHHFKGCLASYHVSADGALQPLGEILVGTWPSGLAVAPGGANAYLFDPVTPLIGQYRRLGGTLQPLVPFNAHVSTNADQLVLRRFGLRTFAYAMDLDAARVRVLSVDAAGQLHDTDNPPAEIDFEAMLLTVHPRRPFAYLSGNHADAGQIHQFALAPQTGGLQWLHSAQYAWGVANPLALLIHPQLEQAYLINVDSNAISRFNIDLGGALVRHAEDTPLPWPAGAMAIAGNGRFLYVTAAESGDIAWWRMNPADGTLTAAGELHIADADALGPIAADANLPWLYVLDTLNRRLHQFEVATDGSLHPLAPAAVEVPAGAVAVELVALP